MNSVTVGVYPNGQYVINIVKPNHLDDHIKYNEISRPGRMLFVDGKYKVGGMFKKEIKDKMIKEWENKISKMNINSDKASKVYK